MTSLDQFFPLPPHFCFIDFSTLSINLGPLRIVFIKSETKEKCFVGWFYLYKWGEVGWTRGRELICISGREESFNYFKKSTLELA